METPGVANINEEDFGYDPTPKATRNLYTNKTLWNGGESKVPMKIETSSIDDGFLKERVADSELPGSKSKISTRVLGLTKDVGKGFMLPRKHVINRLQVHQPIYSTRETGKPMRSTGTLSKSPKPGPDNPKAKSDRNFFDPNKLNPKANTDRSFSNLNKLNPRVKTDMNFFDSDRLNPNVKSERSFSNLKKLNPKANTDRSFSNLDKSTKRLGAKINRVAP